MEGGSSKEQNFWPGFVDALSNVVLVMIFVVVVFVVTLFYYSQKLARFKAMKMMEVTEQVEPAKPKTQADPTVVTKADTKPEGPPAENPEQTKEISALKAQVAALQARPAPTPPAPTPPAPAPAPDQSREIAALKAQIAALQAKPTPTVAAPTPVTPPASAEQTKEIAALKTQIASLQAKLAVNTSNAPLGSLRSQDGPVNKTIEIIRKKPATPESVPGVLIDSQQDAITLRFADQGVELTPEAIKLLDANVKRWVDRLKAGQGKLNLSASVGTLAYSTGKERAYRRNIALRNYLIDLGVPKEVIVTRVVPGKESAESDSTVLIQYSASAK